MHDDQPYLQTHLSIQQSPVSCAPHYRITLKILQVRDMMTFLRKRIF